MSTVERKRPPSNSSASSAHSPASSSGSVTAKPWASSRSERSAQSSASGESMPVQRDGRSRCEASTAASRGGSDRGRTRPLPSRTSTFAMRLAQCSRTTLPSGSVRSWTRSQSWLASHRPQPLAVSRAPGGRGRPAAGRGGRCRGPRRSTVSSSCQTRRVPSPPPWRMLLVATSWVASTRSPARCSLTPAWRACSATSARMPPSVSHVIGCSAGWPGGSAAARRAAAAGRRRRGSGRSRRRRPTGASARPPRSPRGRGARSRRGRPGGSRRCRRRRG